VSSPAEEHTEGNRAAALVGVAHSSVLAVVWADVHCSSKLCNEYESSKIWK
jgi:hypothetical protein